MIQRGRAEDPVAYLRGVEQRARERQVAYETINILRKRVADCYKKSGADYKEKCREVGQAYMDAIEKKDLGQLQPEWSDPKKKGGWW